MLSTTKSEFLRIVQPHKVLFVKNTAHAAQRWFCRVKQRQNESGVLRDGWSFRDNPRWGSVQNEHDHILWMASGQSTKAAGFVAENITHWTVRQDNLKKLLRQSGDSRTYRRLLELFFLFTATMIAIGGLWLVRAEKGFHNLLQRIMSSTLPASSKDDLMGV